MASLEVCDTYIVVSKGIHLDIFDNSNHTVLNVPITSKTPEFDTIADFTISSDCKHLALITSASKELHVFNLPDLSSPLTFYLPRSASKIRFTANNTHVLVADKSGDALIFDIKSVAKDSGVKILGHLSLLLDILQTKDEKYIITTDRDEKIKVSCYPNTYNIQTYCLGHTEFVGHIELLPHNLQYLLSSSGDGCIKIWEITSGKLQHSIITNVDVSEANLKEEFIRAMNADGLQVTNLPVVHFTVTKDEAGSLIATMVHSSNEILIYIVESIEGKFQHKLKNKIKLSNFPADIKFLHKSLFVYNSVDSKVKEYKPNETGFQLFREINMFNEKFAESETKCNSFESIKLLYKRKFDNVQEYQERKKQRLENK